MSAHDLILEYVEAARAIERWTTRAEQLTCPPHHLDPVEAPDAAA